MHPILLELPGLGLRVHAYSVMIFLACSGALWVTLWRARRAGLNVNSVFELAAWLFLGGVIGARLLFVLQNPRSIGSVADLWQRWDGGNIFYGCIFGGLAGSLLYWQRKPFPFWPMADAVAPALAVGITLGRVGCFLHGCCFGERTETFLGMRFPAGSHAWSAHVEAGILPVVASHSLPVHPTQLYAAAAGAIILVILLWRIGRKRRDGEIMALLMMLYAGSRWLIEVFRGDEPPLAWGMTLSQLISAALLIAGGWLWWRLFKQPTALPAAPNRPHRADSQALPARPSS